MNEHATHRTTWEIQKRRVGERQPYATEQFDGNLLLNAGITLLLTKGIGGAGTAYSAPYIEVGDSTTAASATQTGVQASTNKATAAMVATYPQVSNQSVVFRAEFGDGTAEFAWNEFSVSNAAAFGGTNLNRKVEAKGTKASGEVWTVTCTITLS